MTYRALRCFKAYDIRGRIGVELDGDVAYRVGRAVAQHFEAKSVAITGRRGNAVVIAEDNLNSINETLFLLSVPGMRGSII